MTSYRVGQIIYVVLRKEARVYPMQVVEEITKKTLDGQATTYMIKGGAGADQVLGIDQVDGEIFDTADKVLRTLVERATDSITQRVIAAAEKAKEWYPTGYEALADDALAVVRKAAPPAVPAKPKPPKRDRGQPSPEVAALAAELRQDADDAMGAEVVLPDGTRAKVRSVKVPPELQG